MSELTIKGIVDSQIVKVKSLGLKLKTVDHYEGKYNPLMFETNIVLAPFVLIHLDYDGPKEDQRVDTEEQTLRDLVFNYTVGSRSLLGRKESKDDCYTILDGLEAGLEGVRLTTDGIQLPALKQAKTFWLDTTKSGLVIYQRSYILTFNKHY